MGRTPRVSSRTSSPYGLSDITDGSSNTVAFGESLVGNGGNGSPKYPGNGVAGICYAWIYDASSNPTQTLATLQTCNGGLDAGDHQRKSLRRKAQHRDESGLSLGLGLRGDDADQHDCPAQLATVSMERLP